MQRESVNGAGQDPVDLAHQGFDNAVALLLDAGETDDLLREKLEQTLTDWHRLYPGDED